MCCTSRSTLAPEFQAAISKSNLYSNHSNLTAIYTNVPGVELSL